VKDVIRRRGENISAAQLEAIACEHPVVFAAAAVGIPSPYGEEDVKIVLVLREGRLGLDMEAFISFLQPRCPKFMVPRYVEVVEAFPLTASGRIRKFLLQEAGITSSTWDRDAD
jgi:crotonobetaine/carnitine-CoA ligase